MNGNDTAITQIRSFGRSHLQYIGKRKSHHSADDKETGITEMYAKDKFISKMDTKKNAS